MCIRDSRDARTIAGELHTALHNAGLPGPYILVGASLGGPYATVFADTYRDEVAGLVLLDSVHPDQLERLPPQARRALAGLRIVNRVLPMLARLGLTHLVDVTGILLAGMPSKLPADAAGQLRTFAHWPGHWAAVDAEVSAWDVTMEQMRRALHGSLRAVSYTHLDVYKRQPTTRSSRHSTELRCWRSSSRPGEPIRSGCTWPPSSIRAVATRSMARILGCRRGSGLSVNGCTRSGSASNTRARVSG